MSLLLLQEPPSRWGPGKPGRDSPPTPQELSIIRDCAGPPASVSRGTSLCISQANLVHGSYLRS